MNGDTTITVEKLRDLLKKEIYPSSVSLRSIEDALRRKKGKKEEDEQIKDYGNFAQKLKFKNFQF
jgi:hypothetical protein